MILILHSDNKVVKVADGNNQVVFSDGKSISEVLLQLASQYPEQRLVWCDDFLYPILNFGFIADFKSEVPVIYGFNPREEEYLGRKIGYVEPSLFIKVNKKVKYPTWQVSSSVGFTDAKWIRQVSSGLKPDSNFDYFLQSFSKLVLEQGMLCYSEPKLLLEELVLAPHRKSNFELFRFVKQHYHIKWIFLLLLNLFLYERSIALFPFLNSLRYKKRNLVFKNETGQTPDSRSFSEETIDIIIPTIGRKKYLHDVLLDLKQQTVLPRKVIIVEQNPLENSVSELDYLTDGTSWPFQIKHIFTHQSGACNARNLALKEVSGKWVFLADDDIRFSKDLLENCLVNAFLYKGKAMTLACLRENDRPYIHEVKQWGTFGSGCSFVPAEALSGLTFDTRFEFGFGEDADFGMQLRNHGNDVLYFPQPQLLHLKAPVGGFRVKPVLAWSQEPIPPKPSPTIMLYKLKYHTPEQRNGYKTSLFLKHYRHQKIKNPFGYISRMRKQWECSMNWATKLKNS
ncbi:glycosyltransferase family 2 protein [Flavobacterium pedocola]